MVAFVRGVDNGTDELLEGVAVTKIVLVERVLEKAFLVAAGVELVVI